MRFSRILFILFIIIPIIEIYLLIVVGKSLGFGLTLLLIILTAVIGTQLLKQQGLYTLNKAQTMMAQGQMPTEALFEGVLLLISGVLLVTPGFFTDVVGLACLIPATRQYIVRYAIQHIQLQTLYPQPKTGKSQTIEGEYSKKED